MRTPILCLFCFLFPCTLFAQQQKLTLFDINSGFYDSDPWSLIIDGSKIYFLAFDVPGFDHSLMSVNNLGTPQLEIKASFLSYGDLCVHGGKIYFASDVTVGGGSEPWIYDNGNFTQVADIEPGSSDCMPYGFVALNDKIYFAGVMIPGLWQYDPVGTGLYTCTTNQVEGLPVAFNNKLYYTANNTATGFELYCFNPADSSVALVMDIEPGTATSYPDFMTVYNNKLYFCAKTSAYGNELYEYDGTNAPVRLTDVNPGPASSIPFQTDHYGRILRGYNNAIYFYGQDASSNYQLFKYDLSTQSASLAATIYPGQPAKISRLTVFNDKLYFAAADASHGIELWNYEPAKGANLVSDINTGATSSNPAFLTVLDSCLYFSATTKNGFSGTGNELYRFVETIGIRNIRFEGDMVVYPNPVQEQANFRITLAKPQLLNLTISDEAGRLVYETGLQRYGSGPTEIPVRNTFMQGGHYYYSCTGEDGGILVSGKLVSLK